jgi:hypothetical protein
MSKRKAFGSPPAKLRVLKTPPPCADKARIPRDLRGGTLLNEAHSCQSCGRAPARQLVIRRHIGMLFLQRFIKIKPTLCRECGTRTVLQYTGRTLVQGWWGMVSLFIANPFTIVMNLVALVQARQLPPPQLSSMAGADPYQARGQTYVLGGE